MKTMSKALVGTIAAGAVAMGSATPAFASDNHRGNGIDAGDVIAGALVIGGIAAVAAAVDNDRDRDYRRGDYRYGDRYDHYDRRDRDNRRYANYGHAERAVQQCVRAAERRAERYGGGRADVSRVTDIDRDRRGFRVEGRIAVNDGYRYGRNDRRGGWDEGRFVCDWERGRVVDVDYRGIRGL